MLAAMEEEALVFEELVGELRELHGRVVGVDVRGGDDVEVLRAEGEFCQLEVDGREVSFQVGGVEPREREGIRFESVSYAVVSIPEGAEARRSRGIAFDLLRITTSAGITIGVWPAMPPRDQYTETHWDTR